MGARRAWLAVAAAVALSVTASGCWLQPGYEAGRSGWNPDERTLTAATVGELAPLWDRPIAEGFHTYTDFGTLPISVGGTVYATADSPSRGFAMAVDAADGTVRWTRVLEHLFEGNARLVGDPVHHDGRVVVPVGAAADDPDHYGQVYHLDPATGAVLERTVTPDRAYLDAATAGGTLAISSWGLDTPPRVDWTYTAELADARDALWLDRFAIVGGRILWSAGTRAVAFGPDGVEWSTDIGGAMNARPPGSGPAAIGSSGVVYADQTGTVTVLDVATGAVRWTAELGTPVTRSPAVAGSSILVTTDDHRLVALPAAGCGASRCGPLWQADTGAAATGPSAAGDVAYLGTDAGDIQAFAVTGCDADACSPLATVDVGAPVATSPVVDGGRVVAITTDGHLVALGLAAGR